MLSEIGEAGLRTFSYTGDRIYLILGNRAKRRGVGGGVSVSYMLGLSRGYV